MTTNEVDPGYGWRLVTDKGEIPDPRAKIYICEKWRQDGEWAYVSTDDHDVVVRGWDRCPCDVCKAKLPLWEDYQRKSAAAGAALRAVLSAGKRIEELEEVKI